MADEGTSAAQRARRAAEAAAEARRTAARQAAERRAELEAARRATPARRPPAVAAKPGLAYRPAPAVVVDPARATAPVERPAAAPRTAPADEARPDGARPGTDAPATDAAGARSGGGSRRPPAARRPPARRAPQAPSGVRRSAAPTGPLQPAAPLQPAEPSTADAVPPAAAPAGPPAQVAGPGPETEVGTGAEPAAAPDPGSSAPSTPADAAALAEPAEAQPGEDGSPPALRAGAVTGEPTDVPPLPHPPPSVVRTVPPSGPADRLRLPEPPRRPGGDPRPPARAAAAEPTAAASTGDTAVDPTGPEAVTGRADEDLAARTHPARFDVDATADLRLPAPPRPAPSVAATGPADGGVAATAAAEPVAGALRLPDPPRPAGDAGRPPGGPRPTTPDQRGEGGAEAPGTGEPTSTPPAATAAAGPPQGGADLRLPTPPRRAATAPAASPQTARTGTAEPTGAAGRGDAVGGAVLLLPTPSSVAADEPGAAAPVAPDAPPEVAAAVAAATGVTAVAGEATGRVVEAVDEGEEMPLGLPAPEAPEDPLLSEPVDVTFAGHGGADPEQVDAGAARSPGDAVEGSTARVVEAADAGATSPTAALALPAPGGPSAPEDDVDGAWRPAEAEAEVAGEVAALPGPPPGAGATAGAGDTTAPATSDPRAPEAVPRRADTEDAELVASSAPVAAGDRPWVRSYPAGVPETYRYPLVPLTRFVDDAAHDFPAVAGVSYLGTDVTFQQLVEQVDRLAAALRELEVGSGDRLAVALPWCPQLVVVLHACWRLGVEAVVLDPTAGGDRLADAIGVAAPVALVVLDELYPQLAGHRERLRSVRHVVVTGVLDALPPLRARVQAVRLKLAPSSPPADAGVLAYRAVLEGAAPVATQVHLDVERHPALATVADGQVVSATHHQVLAGAFQVRLWLPDVRAGKESVVLAGPPSDPFTLVAGLVTAVLAAATAVLPEPRQHGLARTVDDVRPTLLVGVEAAVRSLLGPTHARRDLSSIRVALVEGTGQDPAVRRTWEQRTGGRLRLCRGGARVAGMALAEPVYTDVRTPPALLPPTDGAVRLDGRRGEPGEVEVAGPQVVDGGWVPLGLVGVLDDGGHVQVLGPSERVIAHAGGVSDPDVVAAALRADPAVADAVVRTEYVSGELRLLIDVTAADASVTPDRLERVLADRAPLQAPPARWRVTVPEPAPAAEPHPEPDGPASP